MYTETTFPVKTYQAKPQFVVILLNFSICLLQIVYVSYNILVHLNKITWI